MENETLKASDNPQLANQLLNSVAETEQPVEEAQIVPPSDTTVSLPGGYTTLAGEVYRTAEVRELNGKDEEAIARVGGSGKVFSTILSRGVVSVGDLPATEKILDDLLAGDRDALLIGIYKATFGNTAELGAYCQGCKDIKTVALDMTEDIHMKVLADPSDRRFTVKGRKNEYLVALPTGITQKELASNTDRTYAENLTLLLEQTVLEINGRPVVSKSQVQALGIVDRQLLTEAIAERNPGPQFQEIVVTCPDCESEVQVPISLGTLFRV
jgi:hypothetical protein